MLYIIYVLSDRMGKKWKIKNECYYLCMLVDMTCMYKKQNTQNAQRKNCVDIQGQVVMTKRYDDVTQGVTND